MSKERKLSPRAQRVVDGGQLLHGNEWMSKFAINVGCSKQTIGFIASGTQPVSDKIDALVVAALKVKARELREKSAQLLALSKINLTNTEK